jgi:hypothetical protein
MRTYTILTTDGRSLRVTADKFYDTLHSKDSDGKSLYWLYDEGQDYVLMPKCDLTSTVKPIAPTTTPAPLTIRL